VTEKHPMSPESNLMALLAYWLSRFWMSNNRGDNVRLETFVMAAKLSQGITLSLCLFTTKSVAQVYLSSCKPYLASPTFSKQVSYS
jgi:hypothetical protein